MESIIRKKLINHLNRLQGFPTKQHEFPSDLSTTTNLVESVFDWSSAVNQGNPVDVFYVDLPKPLDRVNHRKLLQRLSSLDIGENLLERFSSYLEGRQMTVRISRQSSKRYCCPSGVPQGGVPSLLLFLIYTIEMPLLLKAGAIR